MAGNVGCRRSLRVTFLKLKKEFAILLLIVFITVYVLNSRRNHEPDEELFKPGSYRYRYSQPSGDVIKAISPLNISENETQLLRHHNSRYFITLREEDMDKFVFVTAADDGFYSFALGFLETVMRHRPNHTVYFYDLGLTAKQVEKVKGMETCGIKYRKFNFDNYPPHVKELRNFAWKPLIIAEVLLYEPGVLWADSSVKLYSGNFTRMYADALRNNGIVTLTNSGTSTYAVTNPGTYDFLPIDPVLTKREQQRESTVLLYRTKFVMEQIVLWFVLCALNPECIEPTGAQSACFDLGDRFTKYGDCHRYDQSVLNILLLNEIRNSTVFHLSDQKIIGIERWVEPSAHAPRCMNKTLWP